MTRALLAILLLTACGSPPGHTPTAEQPAESRTCGSSVDYTPHWGRNGTPTWRVCDRTGDPAVTAALESAAEQWHQATGLAIVVDSLPCAPPEDPALKIAVQYDSEQSPTGAQTWHSRGPGERTWISLGVDAAASACQLNYLAVHELGHAIGQVGHHGGEGTLRADSTTAEITEDDVVHVCESSPLDCWMGED